MFRQRVGIVRMYVVASLAETDRQTATNQMTLAEEMIVFWYLSLFLFLSS